MPRGPRLPRSNRTAITNHEPEPVPDFRDPATRRADQTLEGSWWRCQTHGLTPDPVILSSVAYCPDLTCFEPCILAHSVPLYDSPRQSWGWAGPDDSPVRLADDLETECYSCVRDVPLGETVVVHARRSGERHICIRCASTSRVRAVRIAATSALGN